jgi:hypothetical protein
VADIKNYTLNFVSGRRASHGLTCASRRLAFNEVELRVQILCVPDFGRGL